jgi:hypothetical protein
MRVRKNLKRVTADEKRLFIEAVIGLKGKDSVLHPGSQSRYDDFVEVHLGAMLAMQFDAAGNMTYPGWAHGDSAFLPWHRELLFRFEEELRAVKPDTANVTIPYWDWTRDHASGDPGFPFKHDFIGVDGAGQPQDRVPQDPAAAGMTPYPHPFDPQAWSIEVIDGVEPAFLVRHFAPTAFPFGLNPGDSPRAPALPENNAIVSDADGPVVNSSFRDAIAAVSYAQLRLRSESIHNLVHRWVSGNMLMMCSPNDPVFWLHHCAIDRMWTLWQEKQPGLAAYTNATGEAGHAAGDTLIFNEAGDPAPWSGIATPLQLVDGHATHGESIWYDSDLPEIALDSGPTLDFGTVPEDLTTYRAVRFRANMFRQVRFRITGAPTGNFGLTPMGTEFRVEPTYGPDPVYGYVWVQFHAVGVASQSSAVDIEAYLIDEEGYYAATEGGEVILGSYHVDLQADVLALESNAVVMVLDRSGSMAAAAGGSSTRGSLLKSAVSVFHTLLRPAEEVGIVSFDDLAETPLPLTTQSAGLGTVLTGPALDPRGFTGIGLGVLAGSGELASASHPNRSLLVLTDGNENVHPYVSELPSGTINGRVYAIGFGLPGEVSDAVLNQMTQNSAGDLIITGNISTDAERFLLTKHFVQILAGVTSASIVLDPQAELFAGSEHAIPFAVTDSDVTLDVISLCPIPLMLDFELRTPDGSLVTAAGAGPNVQFVQGSAVSFYRMLLPALPVKPLGSHGGTWHAVFRLRKPDEIRRWLNTADAKRGEALIALRKGTLPYSLVVHTRSNLEMAASLRQSSLTPGTDLHLTVQLMEYGVPIATQASVWADVTRPNRSTAVATFSRIEPGTYTAVVPTSAAGVYGIRVRAEGASSGGFPFMREKTFSAGVFAGGDRPPLGASTDVASEALCGLLTCLLSDSVLDKRAVARWKKAGIDVTALKECVEKLCVVARQGEMPMATKRAVKTRPRNTGAPKVAAAKAGERDSVFRQAMPPEPVPRQPRLDPEVRHQRAVTATKHFHMDPFPTLVEGGHRPHGPDHPQDPGGGPGGHGGNDHGGHDHGGPQHGHPEHVPTRTPRAKKR